MDPVNVFPTTLESSAKHVHLTNYNNTTVTSKNILIHHLLIDF